MNRVFAYNIFLDFVDFLKLNRAKLVIAILMFLAGMGLGIGNALNVGDANNYLIIHKNSTLLLILGDKSAVSYFFLRLLTFTAIAAIIVLLSFNFYFSLLGFIILFFFSYIFTLYFTLYIILFKIAVLPLLFLCLIPCFIIAFFILTVVVIICFNRGREIHCFGCHPKIAFPIFVRKILPSYVILIALCLLESVLAYFLTLGIIL